MRKTIHVVIFLLASIGLFFVVLMTTMWSVGAFKSDNGPTDGAFMLGMMIGLPLGAIPSLVLLFVGIIYSINWPTQKESGKIIYLGYLRSMSITQIKQEIQAMPSVDQDALAAYLTVVRLSRESEFRDELSALKNDSNPDNWMSLDVLKQKLG